MCGSAGGIIQRSGGYEDCRNQRCFVTVLLRGPRMSNRFLQVEVERGDLEGAIEEIALKLEKR